MNLKSFPFVAAAVVLATSAQAHISLEHPTAHAGSFYKANFKVGHACGQSPIRQIVVQIPAGVRGAKPMPKPGWGLSIERAPLARPEQDHGRMVTDDVVRITWTARTEADQLSPEHYDEFALNARLPAQAGPLYWSVSQVCVDGRLDWTERPTAGQGHSQLKAPAALLDLLPAAGAHSH